MVPQALRYNLCNVAAQWTALVANVVLMLLIGLFLQRLFDGVAVVLEGELAEARAASFLDGRPRRAEAGGQSEIKVSTFLKVDAR